MKIANIISKLLLRGQNEYCCLCFDCVDANAFRLQDEIVMNLNINTETVEYAKILKKVLGEKYTSNIGPFNSICRKCTDKAKTSYDFIKTCENNSECLVNVLDSLRDCLNNTIDDVENFNSIFIHTNTMDYSSEQYYDKENIVKYPKSIANRFLSIYDQSNNIKRKKNVKEPKARRTRTHNYSEEMAKICDILCETNRSKFRCKVCSAVFTKSFNFKKHYYSQHSSKTCTCTECGKCYGSEALLKQHKYDSHACIMCNHCGKTYTNRYSLLYHMRQHTGEQPYECPHCDMKFHWSSRRAEHIRRYHLEPGVECNICHLKFRALGSLYEHRKRHFNPSSRLHVTQQTPPVAEEQIIALGIEDIAETDSEIVSLK